ncbi:MAG TPA: hypothetical protein VFN99_05660 [Gaiella sp.]|nr:hypothetical protein [Gaiella sp.]
MSLYGRSTRWAALALGLAGLLGVSAALVLAAPARSAATEFELTFEGTWEWNDVYFFGRFRGGTFRSRAPFCATGTFVEDPWSSAGTTWRFTCDDGTGGLTVSTPDPGFYLAWQGVEGSGSYADLRGGISLRSGEPILGGPSYAPGSLVTWRGTLHVVVGGPGLEQGVVGRDAVAPIVFFSSAKARNLRRPARAYALELLLVVRDNVADKPVSYTLRASTGGRELARRSGTAARTDAFWTTLRIRPPAGARTVDLQLSATDEVGNESSVSRLVRLPRR